MINEKNNFLTVSWLSGLLSAEIFISTGEWGVQMPPLTAENSHFLRSGSQGATLGMLTGLLAGRIRWVTANFLILYPWPLLPVIKTIFFSLSCPENLFCGKAPKLKFYSPGVTGRPLILHTPHMFSYVFLVSIAIGSTMMPCNYNHLTRDMRLMVLITIILYTATCTLLS